MKMEKVFAGFSKGVLILLVFGSVFTLLFGAWGIPALKQPKDFEYLLENDISAGMHIKGEVLYAYECFANEETYSKRSDGSRSKGRISSYYYAIPVKDGLIALKVPAEDYKNMENLLKETVAYLEGKAEPSTRVMVDGCVRKMGSGKKLFTEYLKSYGYTQEEIADMGDFLIIEQPASMQEMVVSFLIGVGLILLAVIWFAINCIRYGRVAAAQSDIAALGQKLSEVRANKKKIYVTALLRVLLIAFVFFCCMGGVSGLKEYLSDSEGILLLVVMYVIGAGGTGLYTLRHLWECMEFYEYGIRWREKQYSFAELGSIGWCTVSRNGLFKRDRMETKGRAFDITYLNGAKKTYNRTYLN